MSALETVPTTAGRDWWTIGAFAALVVAFGAVAGPLGVLAGVATALTGALFGAPYAFAIGHVALVVLFPDGIDPQFAAIAEGGFALVLLAPLRRTASPGRVGLVAVASAFALAGVAWVVADAQSIPLAAATLLGLLALAGYGLHRLELVRLGLVPEAEATAQSPDGAEPTAATNGGHPDT